jgi:thiamine biosynthesis lipoprotein
MIRVLNILLFFMMTAGLACAEWHQQQADIMGTRISVEVWHQDQEKAKACMSMVMDEMHRIDEQMSPYIEDSELSRVNREAAASAVTISLELFDLIQHAQEMSEQSDGAFDISFASIGYLYDYRKQVQPDKASIDARLEAIDYRKIKLDAANNSIAFEKEGMRIDLGGIAKGHAVDNGIRILRDCGITNGIVTAGGDSRIIGDKGGRPWMMGVQHPRDPKKLVAILPLSDTAISTSGDYERFFIEEGERVHHIISPKSGQSAKNSMSASVIGPNATTTDALSTTLFVLGPVEGMKLIERMEGFDAVLIDAQGKMHYSSGLQHPEQKAP